MMNWIEKKEVAHDTDGFDGTGDAKKISHIYNIYEIYIYIHLATPNKTNIFYRDKYICFN